MADNTSLEAIAELPLLPPRREMERAFAARDAAYDGVFFVGVRTTGIFCRPSCVSRPRPENVEFLATIRAGLEAGYRPCKRCRPLDVDGVPPTWAAELMEQVAAKPEARWSARELEALGVTPERARRWFQERFGLSFAAWCRAHRLAGAFERIRGGVSLDDAGLDAGFESQSGFRTAFERAFGTAPGQVREGGERVVADWIESPVGPLLVATRDAGVCLLEYSDGRRLEPAFAAMRKRFGCPVVPGRHPLLQRLRTEVEAYFRGELRAFTLPVATRGSAFQEEVWAALREIPYGGTLSYAELADRLGRPTGQRAVARANAQNPVSLLVPCHRVIGKDGTLTGYGGGLWRKRLLLVLEQTGRLPA